MSDHFNRSLKWEYSWLSKGVTNSIVNIYANVSWSMISAVISNREFMSLIVENTWDSHKFCDFTSILKYELKYTEMLVIKIWICDGKFFNSSFINYNSKF